MALKIAQRKEDEVPLPSGSRVNEDLVAIKAEMAKLGAGMVLEIDAGSEQAVRATKMLVTRAAGQLGVKWRHWSMGTKVFAKPAGPARRRPRGGRPE
jgi:hypothetical protein